MNAPIQIRFQFVVENCNYGFKSALSSNSWLFYVVTSAIQVCMPYLMEQKGTKKQPEDLDYFFRVASGMNDSALAVSSKKLISITKALQYSLGW